MRVKSPEEMIKALENCAELGPCTNCPYDEVSACVRELNRDATEIILALLNGVAMKTEPEAADDTEKGGTEE